MAEDIFDSMFKSLIQLSDSDSVSPQELDEVYSFKDIMQDNSALVL